MERNRSPPPLRALRVVSLATSGGEKVFVGRDETLQRGIHDFIRRELGVRGHLFETFCRLHLHGDFYFFGLTLNLVIIAHVPCFNPAR